jgi:DNA invertase Pin-like site-specific DNA recombinase
MPDDQETAAALFGEDPSRVMMRQIAGAFHQYERARLVAKLKAARDRKRAGGMKVEGRRSPAEIDAAEHGGQMVALARKLRRKTPKGVRRSLRVIAMELEKAGYMSRTGRPFAPTAVARMLG